MTPDSLLNLNGNMLAVIDVETTGRLGGWHEIVQIAVLPLDSEIEPSKVHKPFYMHLVPQHPDRIEPGAMKVNGLDFEWLISHGVDPDLAADRFGEWFDALELPYRKKLCPIAHNWAFEKGFLTNWLGLDMHDALFHPHSRDTQHVASFLNDAAAYHGKDIPFGSLSQSSVCKKFGISNTKEHDALADCLTCANLYRALIRCLGHAT